MAVGPREQQKGELMPDYVSKTDCRTHHNRIWQVGLSTIGVFVLATSWAVMAGHGAQRKVDVLIERSEATSDSLERIEANQVRMDTRFDVFYKRNGGG